MTCKNIKRRDFIKKTAISSAALTMAFMTSSTIASTLNNDGTKTVEIKLVAAIKNRTYLKGKKTKTLAFNKGYPIIRIKQGDTLKVNFENKLNMESSIHWHGIRLKNEMDGVPHITQKPVKAGGSFLYEFKCVDAGSFWFHPHINSKKQMGEGLLGILIIEDETKTKFDNDVVWGYHDLTILEDGSLEDIDINSMSARHGAMTAGSFGNYPTINGTRIARNTSKVKAGSITRLRILNMDNSRLLRLGIYLGDKPYKKMKIIAIDGNSLKKPLAYKNPIFGPGQRIDIAIEMPTKVGAKLSVINHYTNKPYKIGTLKTTTEKSTASKVSFPPLPRQNRVPAFNIKTAKTLEFTFERTQVRPMFGGSELWGINLKSWGNEGAGIPDPIARLKLGKSYIFKLTNNSNFTHPIHLHGYSWRVLSSNQGSLVGHLTATVLIRPAEVVKVAFLADNKGKWMYHCHIVDHMVSGMMGYVEVV